jgi:hypothetical protein
VTSSRFRRRQQPAIPGDFADDRDITEVLQAGGLPAWDGTTWEGAGIGLPDGVTAIAIKVHGAATEPIARLRALPPPQQHVLAPVPVTEPAVIGDELRLPVVWCEAAACIGWYHDPDSAGFADARRRAIAAGWRYDAHGLFTCPDCQQRDPAFRITHPPAWHHLEVRRRWELNQPVSEEEQDRLEAEAELGRRISREDPALARAIAYATERHERRAGAS